MRDVGGVAGEEKVVSTQIGHPTLPLAYVLYWFIIGHSNLIFGFWSYPSFLHDAGGWVIKTIGLC